MPEGDSLRRAAERVRVLEGEIVQVVTPNPRAASLGLAERLDGKRLERVEAVGKNLLLTFEGGLVLRSHLRMKGRWRVRAAGAPLVGSPWLVLRGREAEAVLWHGPVLELTRGRARLDRLGPDVLDDPPDLDGIVARLRATGQERELGEALLDQRLVAGIGNLWRAEGLFLAQLSPWARLGDLSDDELRRVLAETAAAMRAGRRSQGGLPPGGTPVSHAAGRRSSRGRRATTRAWPTGVPRASRGRQAPGEALRNRDDHLAARAGVGVLAAVAVIRSDAAVQAVLAGVAVEMVAARAAAHVVRADVAAQRVASGAAEDRVVAASAP